MLKINIAKGEDMVVHADGEIGEILTEFTMAFNKIWNAIRKAYPGEAECVKIAMQLAVIDSSSPFWRDFELDGEESIQIIKVPEL